MQKGDHIFLLEAQPRPSCMARLETASSLQWRRSPLVRLDSNVPPCKMTESRTQPPLLSEARSSGLQALVLNVLPTRVCRELWYSARPTSLLQWTELVSAPTRRCTRPPFPSRADTAPSRSHLLCLERRPASTSRRSRPGCTPPRTLMADLNPRGNSPCPAQRGRHQCWLVGQAGSATG